MRRAPHIAATIATSIAVLIGAALPASAAGPDPVEVTSGVWQTALGTFDLTPGAGGIGPCEDEPDLLSLATDADSYVGAPETWSVEGTFSRQLRMPAVSGPWYWFDFTVFYGSHGTWEDISLPTVFLLHDAIAAVQVRVSVIGSGGSPDCSKEDAACTITGIYAGEGVFSGTLPTPTPGDATSLDLDTRVAGDTLWAPDCDAPFDSLADTDADFDDLVLVLV